MKKIRINNPFWRGMLKKILVICFVIVMVLSAVYILDKPNIRSERKVYDFIEKTDFDISSIIKFGVTVIHIDGHQVDYVCITMKDFPEIKSLEVYREDDSLIVLIEDNKEKPKRDRMFTATQIEGIYDVLDHIKVYRNGKRYYFIRSTIAIE